MNKNKNEYIINDNKQYIIARSFFDYMFDIILINVKKIKDSSLI